MLARLSLLGLLLAGCSGNLPGLQQKQPTPPAPRPAQATSSEPGVQLEQHPVVRFEVDQAFMERNPDPAAFLALACSGVFTQHPDWELVVYVFHIPAGVIPEQGEFTFALVQHRGACA